MPLAFFQNEFTFSRFLHILAVEIMRILALLLIAFFGQSLCAQTPKVMSKKTLKKEFPGVVPLQGDYLFIDETEVSNGQWKEFLYWLKKYDTLQYSKMWPDTTVWRSKLAFNEPFVTYYFQHPAYRDYPVVGISYSQAQAFCQWRTDRVLELLKLKNSPIKKLGYRLPSEEEWKKAAWGTLLTGSMWPWEGDGVRWKGSKKKLEGLMKLNFKAGLFNGGGIAVNYNNAGFITTPVYSYWPNTIGLYNMCGNVAEWTEEHKAIGGSWNDFGYHCQINTPKPVLHDSTRLSTLGFRCVAEIIELQDEYGFEPLELTAKVIQKQMRYIPDSSYQNLLFASETETSNEMYFTFLQETKDSNHSIQNQNWETYTRYFAQQMYGSHKAYSLYPVVNIDYQDALAYCEWLTNKYNNSTKRKYNKVQFRLPTLGEWDEAARGGKDGSMFPWGGPYTQNSKGCHLANFSPLEMPYLDSAFRREEAIDYRDSVIRLTSYIEMEQIIYKTNKRVNPKVPIFVNYVYTYPNNDRTISRGADGSYYPARVDAYFPNNYGLYNCAGNVSEMLAEKGTAKGGNWTSSQYQIQINYPIETYTSANPTLGFRVFMKVLKE